MSESIKQAETRSERRDEPGRSWNLSRGRTRERELEAVIHCFRELGTDEIPWQIPFYRCGFKPDELDAIIADGYRRGYLLTERRENGPWFALAVCRQRRRRLRD